MAPLPAVRKGYVTFGSFNNNCKVIPLITELWAKILKANDNFRFLLKFQGGNDQELKNHYFQEFERLGIGPERVGIYGWKSPVEHLHLYREVDIALDTYPYHGTTTTCEALWMGVPTVSLVGKRHACVQSRTKHTKSCGSGVFCDLYTPRVRRQSHLDCGESPSPCENPLFAAGADRFQCAVQRERVCSQCGSRLSKNVAQMVSTLRRGRYN
ncbi:MAG: O-linked N-acetylglucosamine transferase family protein [Planctomycetota bacterium]